MNELNKYKLCGGVAANMTCKLLYLMLNELADANGETTVPQRKISEALRVSKGTVSRNLLRLRDKGYISIYPQYRSEDGGRTANKYHIVK